MPDGSPADPGVVRVRPRRPAVPKDFDVSPQHEALLIVDDDPIARMLTVSALSERGWRVLEADSGPAALEAFVAHKPALVLLDALMPGMDGFAACERLRRLPGGQHVPVLMLTGLDDENSIVRAYEAGATDFFVKTTHQWTLLSQRLRYMLRSSRTRDELVASRAKLAKAQRIARLGSWEWDVARHEVRLSEECFALAGLASTEAPVADWLLWTRLAHDERGRLAALFAEALAANRHLTFETRVVHADGTLHVAHIDAEIELDAAGRPRTVHGIAQDITERRAAEEKIRRLADYDNLTGLPNRRLLQEQLAAAIERARQRASAVGVLLLDVDRFKFINDSMGHAVGDQMLREVAARLQQLARTGLGHGQHGALTLVARLGGDEFMVVVESLDGVDGLELLAREVSEQMHTPLMLNGQEVFVTVSIGGALYPHHGEDVETLVRKADAAMYAVKDDGRSGWRVFSTALQLPGEKHWRLESALHHAIERQELVLHYQPKVDVSTGAIVGAEALMRWRRDGVMVPPSDFIGLAEDTGLIVPMTEWAIAEVCRQQRAWLAAGRPVMPVSVNVSARHVQRADLIGPIDAALAAFQIPAHLLEIELTESVLMSNLDGVLPFLVALRQLGIRISIDDFGTGYSSLAYLKRLPIDVLKIDRSFVAEIETSADGAAIAEAIIAMARTLKLGVVAEGVETDGQARKLAAAGCLVQQGWRFARAVDPADFDSLWAQGADGRWAVAAPARPKVRSR